MDQVCTLVTQGSQPSVALDLYEWESEAFCAYYFFLYKEKIIWYKCKDTEKNIPLFSVGYHSGTGTGQD